jgi:putative SOS response-associated peptidase YedK
MCGRYASFLPAEALARLFGTAGPLPNLEPTWNMAPTKGPIERTVNNVRNDGPELLVPNRLPGEQPVLV